MVLLDIRELGEDTLEGEDTARRQRWDRCFFVWGRWGPYRTGVGLTLTRW